MIAVIQKIDGEEIRSDKSDEYVAGRFDAAIKKPAPEKLRDVRSDSVVSSPDVAREAMIAYNRTICMGK
jgi:hypothetical protein